MNANIGKLIMFIGAIIMVVGAVIYFLSGKIGWWDWIGKLPGDIRIERENFKMFVPLTTSVVLTIILNLLIWIFRKLS